MTRTGFQTDSQDNCLEEAAFPLAVASLQLFSDKSNVWMGLLVFKSQTSQNSNKGQGLTTTLYQTVVLKL